MKEIICCFALLLLISSCRGQKFETHGSKEKPVRPAAFAGKFYPSDSTKLRAAIKAFLDDAIPPAVAHPIAIIVPHAGYIFSGQIAADAFNQARNGGYEFVVVLGTNHTTAGFEGVSVYRDGGFETPLGSAAVDGGAANELLTSYRRATADNALHENEHSIEVQVPFIQYLFPKARILPVVVSENDPGNCAAFGRALAGVLKTRKALIVASSDLSHYPKFEDAIRIDTASLEAITSLDVDRILSQFRKTAKQRIAQLSTCACGEAPILAAIAAAKELGANKGTVVSYSNSGYNPAGSSDQVVGYGAAVIAAGGQTLPPEPDTVVSGTTSKLDSSEKSALLKYARRTLEQIFATETVPLPRSLGSMAEVKRGAFVTLRKGGELRGCIGSMTDDRPLGTVVGAMALQAAFNDPRFPPLTESELKEVEIEISVLTPFRKVKGADEIVLSRDGVIIRKGNRQAVFLPQVATETGWDKETFLDQLCYKAGLMSGDWKDAQLFTFQADVFSERETH